MIVERLFLSVLKFEELKKQAVFNYSVSYVPNPLTYVRVFGFALDLGVCKDQRLPPTI